jgi:hypothetical protein
MDEDMIRMKLWNMDVDTKSYEGAGEKYRAAILEQYKLYVEMADRISGRRGLTNIAFLTLNTAVSTIIGVVGLVAIDVGPGASMRLTTVPPSSEITYGRTPHDDRGPRGHRPLPLKAPARAGVIPGVISPAVTRPNSW